MEALGGGLASSMSTYSDSGLVLYRGSVFESCVSQEMQAQARMQPHVQAKLLCAADAGFRNQ
jgi:hypothetical protein